MNNANNNDLDEFGRNVSLRQIYDTNQINVENYAKYVNYIQFLMNFVQKHSWVELDYALEEEEERQKEAQEKRKQLEENERKIRELPVIRAQTEKRKELLAKGDYELEEGEIFE